MYPLFIFDVNKVRNDKQISLNFKQMLIFLQFTP